MNPWLTSQLGSHENGFIVVHIESVVELRFPVVDNPRLARRHPRQLNHIEISPFSLHWPELDEDLSFRGLIEGDHGQFQKRPKQQRADLDARTCPRFGASTCRIKESGVQAAALQNEQPAHSTPCPLIVSVWP